MEDGWNLFNNNSSSSGRGHNGNCTNLAWDVWELGTATTTSTTSRFDRTLAHHHHNNNSNNLFHPLTTASAAATAATSTTHPGASGVHALMFHDGHHSSSSSSPSLYVGGGSYYHPDPHLMCLKLGKRHYFEDATPLGDLHVPGFSIPKRGKLYCTGGGVVGQSTEAALTVAVPAAVPRCQVEGCHVALGNAKDYHRRHKVCEMHSKASKVVVLGLEQRFCQQCSRFHVVSEFDDSKRSCRRRLAGHNERRRKSSHDHSLAGNPSSQGRALSLLSSKNESWISSSDLSSRCSAALRELIAENRAAILAKQLIIDRDWHWHHQAMEDLNGHQNGSNPLEPHQHQMFPDPHGWDRFNDAGTNVTLDLMQAPSSAFGLLSMRGKSKEEEECSELWSSFGGTHL